MPLSETKKTQSQSIEDLIAQLDVPGGANSTNHSQLNQTNENSNDAAGASTNRRLIKGKRTTSTGSNGSPNQPSCGGAGGCSSNSFSYSGQPAFLKQSSFGQNSEPLLAKNIIMSKKYSKHMKTYQNKGAPKKGGAGGKHTWGAPGCELNSEDFIDAKDPNYDSEEAGNVVMVCVENSDSSSGRTKKQQQTGNNNRSGHHHNNNNRSMADHDDDEDEHLKELDSEDLETEIKPIILEYFHNGDTIEVVDHFKCYNFNKIRAQLIAYSLQIALEHNNTCKELMSRLLRDLTFELFSEKDFVNGFDLLLKNLNDLTLDNPDASEKIGTFIARAIADKVVPKDYLERFFNDEENNANMPDLTNDKIAKAIESARVLVNMNQHLYQLSHIWGNKGGFLAVKELSDKINEIIQEFYDSGDIDEAVRCLKELNVPHFHHEFIYEAIDFSLQKGNEHSIDLITNLLSRLCQSVIVTYDQLKIGFTRIFDVLPDIALDVPNANALMDNILNKCHAKGFLSDHILDLAPNRSRKRFVSEGDGGRIKENGH